MFLIIMNIDDMWTTNNEEDAYNCLLEGCHVFKKDENSYSIMIGKHNGVFVWQKIPEK